MLNLLALIRKHTARLCATQWARLHRTAAAMLEVLLLVVVTGATVLLARFLRDYVHFRKLELAIPGPPTLPLLGNALDFARVTPDNVLQTGLRLLDNRRGLTRVTIFNHMLAVVSDPAEIEEVVLRRKEFKDKSKFLYSLLKFFAKKGLIPLNGDEWKAHRRWMEPGFNKKVLDSFVEIFTQEAHCFAARIETDKEYDVTENLRRTVVKIFLNTSLDRDSSKFEDGLLEMVAFQEFFLRSVNTRSLNPLQWSDTLFKRSAMGKEVLRMKPVIHELITGMINHRRSLKNKDDKFGKNFKTVMEIVCNQSAGGVQMPEEDVLDEVTTLFAANADTTVVALEWLLKLLSMLPDVQERVYNELIEVLGQGNGDVTHEHIPRLEYLHRVVKESMRMFPPVPMVARQCYAETEVCGRTLPAGTTIVLNILRAHRDPKYWDQPDRFDPDRFLPENSKDRHPCAYVPFSIGSRNCIGLKYAMMNVVAFLATTLKAYRVLPVDDHRDLQSLYDNMTFHVTSRLVGGVRVKFQRRVDQPMGNSD